MCYKVQIKKCKKMGPSTFAQKLKSFETSKIRFELAISDFLRVLAVSWDALRVIRAVTWLTVYPPRQYWDCYSEPGKYGVSEHRFSVQNVGI